MKIKRELFRSDTLYISRWELNQVAFPDEVHNSVGSSGYRNSVKDGLRGWQLLATTSAAPAC